MNSGSLDWLITNAETAAILTAGKQNCALKAHSWLLVS